MSVVLVIYMTKLFLLYVINNDSKGLYAKTNKYFKVNTYTFRAKNKLFLTPKKVGLLLRIRICSSGSKLFPVRKPTYFNGLL